MATKTKSKKVDWYLTISVIGLAVLSFFAGGMLGINKLQPFRHISEQIELANQAATQFLDQRPILLRKKRHAHVGARNHDNRYQLEGRILLQGSFPDGAQVRMIDYSGRTVHKWFVDFFEIWPRPSHVKPWSRVPKSRFNFHTQGLTAQRDGSMVVSIDNLGAAKLDKCSNVVWTVDRSTHHVITSDGDGGFWIAADRDLDQIPDDHLFGKVSRSEILKSNDGYENMILRLDSGGKVVHEISVLEALHDMEFEHRVFDSLEIRRTDPTHINDIEPVSESLAAKLENVEVGDLLVSIRQLHMLAIMDEVTGEIKWTQTGPWVRQHDPDIMPDGTIRVFNNGGGRNLSFDRMPGSNIIEMDPSDRSWEILLPVNAESAFDTDIMGSYQALPNGHHLVAESRAGRVLQFSADKELIWEFIAEYNDEYAALIEIAEWIPEDFFEVDDWTC